MIIKFGDYDAYVISICNFIRFLERENISYQELYTLRNREEGNAFIVTENDIDIPDSLKGNYEEIVSEITGYLISDDDKVVEIPEKTREHMAAHSDVKWSHIYQAVSYLDIGDRTFLMETVELPYVIGKSNCVLSKGKDVQMLYRKGRAGKSPVILDGEGTPTNKITVGICKKEDTYYLFTAFYGEKATREPWDTNIASEEEREECERFWSTHALICTVDEIDWERSKYLYVVEEVYEDSDYYAERETLNVGVANTEEEAREFIKNRGIPSLMYSIVGENPQVEEKIVDGETFFLGDLGEKSYYRIIKVPKI